MTLAARVGLALLALTTGCASSRAREPAWTRWQSLDRPWLPRIAVDAQARWAVVCRPMKSAERRWGPNGARTWSQVPVLYLGEAAGLPVDDYLGADRSGRHLVVVREGAHWIVDTVSGERTRVDGFESLSLDGVLFFRRAIDGRSELVARRLDEAKDVALDLPRGDTRTFRSFVAVTVSGDAPPPTPELPVPIRTTPPFDWCGPWQEAPDVLDAPSAGEHASSVGVYVGSTRTGLVRRVDDFVAPPFPGEVVLRRDPEGELVVEDPADGSTIARVPTSCRATPLATHGAALLVGCEAEGHRWHPWIFDRSGARDLGTPTAFVVQPVGGDLVLLGEPSGPRLLVDLAARTATPFDDGEVLRVDHGVMVVRKGARLWIARRGEPFQSLAPELGPLHVDLLPTLGAWPMASFGPLVVDLDALTLRGLSPGPHAAVSADGRVLTLRGDALRRDFVEGERLGDLFRWKEAPLP